MKDLSNVDSTIHLLSLALRHGNEVLDSKSENHDVEESLLIVFKCDRLGCHLGMVLLLQLVPL